MKHALIARLLLPCTTCAMLLLVAGCQSVEGGSCHKPQAYQSAEDLQPLRVPDGLTGPETDEAMQIPALTATPAQLDPDGPCIDAPPAITAPPLPPSGIVDPPRRRPGARTTEEPASEGEVQPGTGDEPEAPAPERRRRRPTLPR
jgi:hypothetical protein